MLDYVYTGLEYISFFLGILFFKKYNIFSYYKYFLYYLTIVIVFETIGIFLDDSKFYYDLFIYFEFNLIALIYSLLLHKKHLKKVIVFIMIAFSIMHTLLFFEEFYWIRKYSTIAEAVLISSFTILYFKQLLNSNEILNYKKLLSFWISVAFLVFFLASIPFFSLYYIGLLENKKLFPILHILIIVYNSCFIFGLITCRKVKQPSY